jgi:hypothetical protein
VAAELFHADGRTDRRTDRRTDKRTDRRTDRQTGGQTDRETGGLTDRQTDKLTDREMEGWTETQIERRKAGRTDGETDGRTDMTKATVSFHNFANASKNGATQYFSFPLNERWEIRQLSFGQCNLKKVSGPGEGGGMK